METLPLGFVAVAPLSVVSRGAGWCGLRAPLGRALQSAPPQRRARVLALGGAPPPPPPEDEAEGEGAEESVPAAEVDDADAAEVGAEDILSSPVFLKKKLEVVQKELAEAKKSAEVAEDALDKEKDSYVRLAADFENYRRRSAKDLLAQDAKATAKVCREILGVLDNFERAVLAVNAETEKEKSIDSSYQAINKQLLDALVKLNVAPVEAVGETFNPEVHDAIQNAESDEYAEGVVCTQFQRGYTIGETLIRAAMVVVSTGPGPEGEEASEPEQEEGEGAETAEQVA